MSRYPARPVIYILVVGGIIILALVLFNFLSEDNESQASSSPDGVSLVASQDDPDASRVVASGFEPVNQLITAGGHSRTADDVLILSPDRPDERMTTALPL